MLNQVCILYYNWTDACPAETGFKNELPVFVLETTEPTMQRFLSWSFTQNWPAGTQFSVCFTPPAAGTVLQPSTQASCISLACSIVFHAAFYTRNSNPVFFYRHGYQTNKLVLQLVAALKAQSFSKPHAVTITEATNVAAGTNAFLLPLHDAVAAERFYTAFLQDGLFGKYVFLEAPATTPVAAVLRDTEDLFATRFPQQYNYMQLLNNLSTENARLLWQQTEHLAEIENYKTYLQVMRDQDEAATINRFYHNEYEVLPLWYKRLGHVLKVLTGHRSFRSLFDDSVKKHLK